jgi:hypothetical protein
MKRCPRCGEEQPLDSFYRRSKAPDGRQCYCKPCVRDDLRIRAARKRRKLRPRVAAPAGFKYCQGCGETKPLDAFGNNKRSGDRKTFYCKVCHNARTRDTCERLYGGTRHYHLMRRYGLVLPRLKP